MGGGGLKLKETKKKNPKSNSSFQNPKKWSIENISKGLKRNKREVGPRPLLFHLETSNLTGSHARHWALSGFEYRSNDLVTSQIRKPVPVEMPPTPRTTKLAPRPSHCRPFFGISKDRSHDVIQWCAVPFSSIEGHLHESHLTGEAQHFPEQQKSGVQRACTRAMLKEDTFFLKANINTQSSSIVPLWPCQVRKIPGSGTGSFLGHCDSPPNKLIPSAFLVIFEKKNLSPRITNQNHHNKKNHTHTHFWSLDLSIYWSVFQLFFRCIFNHIGNCPSPPTLGSQCQGW